MPQVSEQELKDCIAKSSISNSNLAQKAIEIARNVHKDQTRDNGKPYLDEHIWLIAKSILDRFIGHQQLETLLCCGLLHDVMEDSSLITFDCLSDIFGNEIATIVSLLTKTSAENKKGKSQTERYQDNKTYLSRIANNKLAVIIKIEDRLANLISIRSDVIKLKPHKYSRYVYETTDLFVPLAIENCPEFNYVPALMSEVRRVREVLQLVKVTAAEITFKPIHSEYGEFISTWFEDKDICKFLGTKEWVINAEELIKNSIGKTVRGKLVTYRTGLVALLSNEVVGYIDCECYDRFSTIDSVQNIADSDKSSLSFALVVNPISRGRGIAQAMIEKIRMQPELQSTEIFHVTTNIDNAAMMNVLSKCGFTKLSATPNSENHYEWIWSRNSSH